MRGQKSHGVQLSGFGGGQHQQHRVGAGVLPGQSGSHRLQGIWIVPGPALRGYPETARALLANLRSALPGTTIVAAIHDRTLDHLPVPADATVRLAAGRVVGGLRGPVPER